MMWMFQHGFTSALCLEKALVIEEFSPVLQTILKKEFGDDVKSIPVSILLYPRRCVFGYENRVQSIAKYVNMVGEKDCAEKVGRKKMVEVLGDVGSTFDYHTRFVMVTKTVLQSVSLTIMMMSSRVNTLSHRLPWIRW